MYDFSDDEDRFSALGGPPHPATLHVVEVADKLKGHLCLTLLRHKILYLDPTTALKWCL